ncbi:ABC transporter permease [Streptococcus sp. VTCC 12905]|uniref:ABC-2 type transport system permease protein n=1 Tax=Streptococcus equinus TaxID=1335 RepID=A0A1G9PCN7_STREI|nr:ABC transporter permease [Streptococcus equinus]SDL96484.1 ABC-2 type transport system permease protein [Streptococcus equinus]HEM3638707.1 ABC transporter permease [Streptococcus suis]
MINKFKSLVWLRYRYLLNNKMLLFVCVFVPIVDFALLTLIPDVRGQYFFLNMGIIAVYSLTAGTFTTLIISEEKERKNLRTLILTGVRYSEYLISTILFPIIFSTLAIVIFPFLFNVKIPNIGTYYVVTFLSITCFILVNLTIALICKTQTQASAISLIFYLLIMTLPMFSYDNEVIKKITDYSLLGAHNKFFQDMNNFQISDGSIFVTIIWIIALTIAVIWAFKWNKKH